MKEDYISILKNDGVGIIPTDTLYGLVGSAISAKAVERIYELRQRDKDKPCIILISSIDDVEKFGVVLSEKLREQILGFWPGKVSIIFGVADEKFAYLHRGGKSLAFRLPQDGNLLKILKKTGPLVAPSANPQDFLPARTIDEAKKYFGEKADFYEDGGVLNGRPSAVIRFEGEKIIVIRDGEALRGRN
ncbi:MAG: L-threonylcarbamoyladenylate synthase [Candidatus Pacebacteria bacterium]|nr:L-threonylcarbamoyladenylate synthase [Candidatus Paceibacterota bacterium]MDD5357002.1 L-threonylcarbamoyladenylate synthase [Candidatus Paceibacterota bacterium]